MEILTQCVKVCKPAKSALRQCEGCTVPTLSWVVYCWHVLSQHFKNSEANMNYHTIIRDFCAAANRNTSLKFDRTKDRSAIIAVQLDPRCRELRFLEPVTRAQFKGILQFEYDSIRNAMDNNDLIETQSNKKQKSDTHWSDDVDLDLAAGFVEDVEPISRELTSWLEASNVPRKTDILLWCKSHAAELPILANMAKKYLAVPASSAPSERLFSALKDTAPKGRSNISGKTLCQRLVVSHNLHELE